MFAAVNPAELSAAQQPLTLSNVTASLQQNKHVEQGLAYYRSGEHKLAVQEFEQALQEIPNNQWISYYLARAHFGNNNREAGERLTKKLVREHAEFSRGHFLLGYVYFETHQWTLAESALKKAIQLEPNYWEPHLVLGSTYVLMKRTEDAERELGRAVDLNSDDPETHYYLGRLYFDRNKFPLALMMFS
jgi:tetratricopeptide (TPR) repeat protein